MCSLPVLYTISLVHNTVNLKLIVITYAVGIMSNKLFDSGIEGMNCLI